MKTIAFIFLFIAMNSCVFAQNKFQLPDYKTGKYEKTNIYHYFGALTSSGKGSVAFGNFTPSEFVTGMKFYMLVDSIDQGVSSTHAAFKDSSGLSVPMYKGDKLSIPVSFRLYSGKIGFSIIIEGTPSVAGESYFCDLVANHTVDENWGLVITKSSQQKCNVDVIKDIETFADQSADIVVYPNPATDQLVIKTEVNLNGVPYQVVDKLGKEVQNGLLTSPFNTVNIQKLIAGDYVIQIGTKSNRAFRIIKN